VAADGDGVAGVTGRKQNDPLSAYALPPVSRHRDIACAGLPWQVFYPGPGRGFEEARQVCGRCRHVEECLSWALESGQQHGMWGGASPEEREVMRPLGPRGRGRRPLAEGGRPNRG